MKRREWLRWVAAGASAFALCLVALRPVAAAEPKAIPVGVHQLFLDDLMLERIEGLQRVVNPVVKHRDNPLVVPEKPWEAGTLILDNGVVYDEAARLFKMYCLVPGFVTGGSRRTSYLTSTDGIRWERPELGLVEHEGSTQNNILPVHVSHVVYDPRPDEPAGRAFKGIGYGSAEAAPRAGQPQSGQYAAFSADGVNWKLAEGFQLTGAGDVFTPSRTAEIQKLNSTAGDAKPTEARRASYVVTPATRDDGQPPYVGFVRIVQRVGKFDRRILTVTTSNDFAKWSQAVVILRPDDLDDQLAEQRLAAARDVVPFDLPEDRRCEFYHMVGFRYEGVYLGLMFVFDASFERSRIGRSNQDGPRHVELVFSRDLKQWQRLPGRVPFIPLGPAGQWDCAMIGYAAAPILIDDEVRIYYGGQRLSHGALWEDEVAKLRTGQAKPASSIGLATMRRDGWVSLDAGDKSGSLVTRAFVMPAGRLKLNTDARYGEVSVELLGNDGTPVAKAGPIRGDQLRAVVEFASSTSPAGSTVKLRITARNAKLFSYWFADD